MGFCYVENEPNEEDIILLEKRLGVIKKNGISELSVEKKRKALYKKIEKEDGIGDDFLGLLDGIISDAYTKKRKVSNEQKLKIKKTVQNNLSIISQASNPSFRSANDSILNWQNKYRQKIQGLLNRLSEGNMTLILDNLIGLIKSTTISVYKNHDFEDESLLKLRSKLIQMTLGHFSSDYYVHRLIAVVDIIESDIIMLFIKNLITQPQNTVSLNTVYSALISSVGILLESNLNLRLIIALNYIYNTTLNKMLQSMESNIEIYNNKLILRHITTSLITIYRCGFASSVILEGFIKAGKDDYDRYKSNIIYWECFFDNVLTIIRGSAIYLREENVSIYESIIESIESELPNIYKFESQFVRMDQNHSDNYINPQRFRFIIEEIIEWKNSLKTHSLNQRLKKREGILERQLNTVHSWSLNCAMLKYLQVIRKDKKRVINFGRLDLVSYPKTLIEYKWQDNNENLISIYADKIQENNTVNKLISFYNLDIKQLSQNNIINTEHEIAKNNITNNKLLDLASKMRFTSDIQKSIFIALIGAVDEYDAIHRLTSLNITQSKTHLSSAINVIVISSLSEHIYNPYYYGVLKGLTELPVVISKRINKEIILCFSQKLGMLDTFNVRKIIIFSQLVRDCIFGGIFDLKIIRFININDVHKLAGSIGLFLKELIIFILVGQKKIEGVSTYKLFSDISKMQDLKEIVLFVMQTFVIPAFEENSNKSNNFHKISKIELIELCKLLSNN